MLYHYRKHLCMLDIERANSYTTIIYGNNNYLLIVDHSFSTYAKFSEKITFFTLLYAQVRNVIFSKNELSHTPVLNERSHTL